jgi:hypothetical protein
MAGILGAMAGMAYIAYIGGEARSAEGEAKPSPLDREGTLGIGHRAWEGAMRAMGAKGGKAWGSL